MPDKYKIAAKVMRQSGIHVTSSIPEAQIHCRSVDNHVGAEVIEHSGHVVLQKKDCRREIMNQETQATKRRSQERRARGITVGNLLLV